MVNFQTVIVVLFLLFSLSSVPTGRAQGDQIRQDISQLVDAASRLNTAWPWQKPIPEIKLVARHGKAVGSLLADLLTFESFDQKKPFNLHVEQQIALALCEVYGVFPESGKTVLGIRSSDEQNRIVKEFWQKKVKQSDTSYRTDIGWCQAFSAPLAVSFDGTLRRGERFERNIGENLTFQLAPIDRGWNIVVTESGRSENFAAIVQIPLRFNYMLEIMPWHFGKSHGMPGAERVFEFVLNMDDYSRIEKQREILLWPYSYSESDVRKAEAFNPRVRCGAGRLALFNVTVEGPDDPERAIIKQLNFRAEFSLPW